MGKLESKFQAELKKELKNMFPGCIVTKMDAGDIQGIPDLLILWKTNGQPLNVRKQAKQVIDLIRTIMLT